MATRSNELTEAISAILVQQPFFAVLIMDLLEIHESEFVIGRDQPNPTAYTDGTRIVVNPKFFKKLNVQERIFVMAHEVTHVILQHPSRMKLYHELGYGPDLDPFSPSRFNKAADYVINAYLNELKVGQQPVDTLLNPQFTSADLVDDVYLKMPKDEDDENQGWDTHVPATDDANLPDKATIQRAVASAAGAAKQQGKLPGGLQRLVDGILEPQVTWTEHLRSAISTCVGNTEQTWARPNRRKLAAPPHVYWPGRCGVQTDPISIEIDTSGSIGDHELKTFLSETHGILNDVAPEKIYVGYVDATLFNDEIIEIDDPNDVLDLAQKAGGGGGTDMTIMHQELVKRNIEVGYEIIFTDGYTPFGEDTGVPTIWCITTRGLDAPWGVTVHVEIPAVS